MSVKTKKTVSSKLTCQPIAYNTRTGEHTDKHSPPTGAMTCKPITLTFDPRENMPITEHYHSNTK